MTDYLWHGDPAAITAALFDASTDPETQVASQVPKAGLNIIGPLILDGIAWVNVRTDTALTLPDGIHVSGPELSRVVLGGWAEVSVEP